MRRRVTSSDSSDHSQVTIRILEITTLDERILWKGDSDLRFYYFGKKEALRVHQGLQILI